MKPGSNEIKVNAHLDPNETKEEQEIRVKACDRIMKSKAFIVLAVDDRGIGKGFAWWKTPMANSFIHWAYVTIKKMNKDFNRDKLKKWGKA